MMNPTQMFISMSTVDVASLYMEADRRGITIELLDENLVIGYIEMRLSKVFLNHSTTYGQYNLVIGDRSKNYEILMKTIKQFGET